MTASNAPGSGKRWLAPGTISRAFGPRSLANACSFSSITPKSAPPTISRVGMQNLVQHVAGEIGTPAAGDDRIDALIEPGGRSERRGRAGARAEKPERKPRKRWFVVDEADRIDEPLGQQIDVEHIRATGFLLRGEKVEQKRADAPIVQRVSDRAIAGAEAAGAAAMGEDHKRTRAARHVQGAR